MNNLLHSYDDTRAFSNINLIPCILILVPSSVPWKCGLSANLQFEHAKPPK
jgi:hypothetical protein